MSTSRLILVLFSAFLVMSVIAAVWRPRPLADGKTELTWTTGSNPARLEQLATFNETHPAHRLKLDLGKSDTQKILLQTCSGVGPDVFDVYDGEQLQTYAEAGILWDITEAAREGGFSVDGDLWPSGREEVSYEGRQYAYPCNTGADIVIYNKNVFDHYGVPYPEGMMTWDDFLALARRVNSLARTDRASEASIFSVTGLNWQTFFESLGGQFFTEEGKPWLANNPALERAMEMHRDYIFKERVMPSTLDAKTMSGQGGWGSGGLNHFANSRFAMIVTGEWALIGLSRTLAQQMREITAAGVDPAGIEDPLKRPLRLGCFLLPHMSGQPPRYRVRSRSAAVNARSPKREEALLFLKYLASEPYSRLINESADFLPGNPKYAEVGLEPGNPALARMEMHNATKQAMEYGYRPRRSPYLLTSDILRVVGKEMSRLESDPKLSIPALLISAQKDAESLVQRNLIHKPERRSAYEKLADGTAGSVAQGTP